MMVGEQGFMLLLGMVLPAKGELKLNDDAW
jgi:hypothetical protein